MCVAPPRYVCLAAGQPRAPVPPLDIAGYAQAHDDAVWETLQACLGGIASGEADGARKLATLPAYRARSVLGGMG